MNKKEFAKAIAEKSDLSIKQVETVLQSYQDTIVETLKNGDKVQFVGFGTYELKDKPAREGFNPATGEKIQIPASKNPSLKMGKAFKELFNK